MEGVLLANQTLTVSSLMGFEERNLSASVSNLPYGFSQITVSLTGDVAANTSEYTSSITQVVQRLRPLNISFGGQASVVCLLYTSPSPRDLSTSRMPSSA